MSATTESLRIFWCSFLHGGGDIKRDPEDRINWQCRRCGRWADAVPLKDEAAVVDAAVNSKTPNGRADRLLPAQRSNDER